MKKKLIIFLVCSLTAFSAAACSGGTVEENSSDTASVAANETALVTEVIRQISPEESTPETAGESVSRDPEVTSGAESSAYISSEIDLASVSFSDDCIELYTGETYRLGVHLAPDDATRTDYRWSWNNNSIIAVEPDGTIIAKSAGTAAVTAETYNGLTAVCEVKVVERDYELSDEISELSDLEEKKPIEYKPAPEITGETVDSDWFDDAVFIGDSISVGLCNYADNGSLGDADFLAKEYMGYHSAMWDLDYEYAVHPYYNGVEVRIEDALQEIGKDKVFILLGMNDICNWGVEESIDAMKDFTDMLLEKNPDITIYMQSATPIIGSKVRDDYLNNENIAAYNERLKEVCAERGFVYVDIYSVMSDENGALRDDYCSDAAGAGHHFNRAGFDAWVGYLKSHVQ